MRTRIRIAVVLTGLLPYTGAAEDLLISSYTGGVTGHCLRDGRVVGELTGAGARLRGPQSIVRGPDGLLYVCSEERDRVLRFDARTWAFVDAFVRDDPGTPEDESGGLAGPTAAAFGPDGHLYVASFNTDNVLRYDGNSGAFLDEFVTSGSGGLDGPDAGMRFDAEGNLLVPGYWSNAVLRFDGVSGAPLAPLAASGTLLRPRGLLPRPDVGDLLVTAEGSDAVLRVDPAGGGILGTFAAIGEPSGIARDGHGRVYVARVTTGAVRRFLSDGTPDTTVVAAGGSASPTFLYMANSRRCAGDIDGDGDIDLDDLLMLLVAFGRCAGEPGYAAAADLDGDQCVDLDDLLTLLGGFGA